MVGVTLVYSRVGRGALVGVASRIPRARVLAAVVVGCHLLALRGLWQRLATRLPAPVMGAGYAAVLLLALVLAPNAGKAFIYFQF